jgi:uncharacterized protein (DUF2267 family)
MGGRNDQPLTPNSRLGVTQTRDANDFMDQVMRPQGLDTPQSRQNLEDYISAYGTAMMGGTNLPNPIGFGLPGSADQLAQRMFGNAGNTQANARQAAQANTQYNQGGAAASRRAQAGLQREQAREQMRQDTDRMRATNAMAGVHALYVG